MRAIQYTLTVDATIESFNATAARFRIASMLEDVEPSQVFLAVTSASLRVVATITPVGDDTRQRALAALASQTPTTLSTALDVAVDSVEPPKAVVAEFDPSQPDAGPTRLLDDGSDSTSDGILGFGPTMDLVIFIASGALVLLVLVAVCVCRLRSHRHLQHKQLMVTHRVQTIPSSAASPSHGARQYVGRL